MLPLSKCSDNEKVKIEFFNLPQDTACRLREMGLCEGMHVTVESAPQCCVTKFENTRLCIDRLLSENIFVTPQ